VHFFYFGGVRIKRFPFGCIRDGRHFSRDSNGNLFCSVPGINRKVQEHFLLCAYVTKIEINYLVCSDRELGADSRNSRNPGFRIQALIQDLIYWTTHRQLQYNPMEITT
jgi:hypothetical protein